MTRNVFTKMHQNHLFQTILQYQRQYVTYIYTYMYILHIQYTDKDFVFVAFKSSSFLFIVAHKYKV